MAESQRKYAAKHRNQRHAYAKAYREKNREKLIIQGRKYYQDNREKRRERDNARSRIHDYARKYGISVDAYGALVMAQHGVCALCGKMAGHTKNLCVDHDHATGKVRGLLCHRCNQGLGLFLDNAAVLGRAVKYLKRNRIEASIQMPLFDKMKLQEGRAIARVLGKSGRISDTRQRCLDS